MPLKLVKTRCYHVDGWKVGTFFRLVDIEGDIAVLQRPKHSPNNGRKWRVPLEKLRNTKRHGAKKQPVSPTKDRT